jgi:16S rRNA (guanine527-N7)-methyltransferase
MTQHDPSEADWKARLVAGARALRVELAPTQSDALWRLALALRERNAQVNLTAVDTLDGILSVHILDSLSVVAHLGAARRVIDVGTGGGFPGLPLALACPEREFVLIDGTQKKITFVQQMIDALRLTNAQAHALRAEQYRPTELFDVVIVRAVAALEKLIKQTGHLLRRPDGLILAMKGKHPEAEIAALPRGWHAAAVPLNVPTLAAERTLITLSRSR